MTHTREYHSDARGGTVYIYYFRSLYEAKPVPRPALTQNSGDATGPIYLDNLTLCS